MNKKAFHLALKRVLADGPKTRQQLSILGIDTVHGRYPEWIAEVAHHSGANHDRPAYYSLKETDDA